MLLCGYVAPQHSHHRPALPAPAAPQRMQHHSTCSPSALAAPLCLHCTGSTTALASPPLRLQHYLQHHSTCNATAPVVSLLHLSACSTVLAHHNACSTSALATDDTLLRTSRQSCLRTLTTVTSVLVVTSTKSKFGLALVHALSRGPLALGNTMPGRHPWYTSARFGEALDGPKHNTNATIPNNRTQHNATQRTTTIFSAICLRLYL